MLLSFLADFVGCSLSLLVSCLVSCVCHCFCVFLADRFGFSLSFFVFHCGRHCRIWRGRRRGVARVREGEREEKGSGQGERGSGRRGVARSEDTSAHAVILV